MNKYTISIGLNDKDTKKQIIKTDDAFQIVAKKTMAIFDGATISAARGIYKHESGALVYENTIIVSLITENAAGVADLISYVKKALNQESVMLETQSVNISFI